MKLKGYEEYLRQQRCVTCGKTPCNPSHVGNHGTAKRLHDEDACSQCFDCHRLFHDKPLHFSREGLQRIARDQFKSWLATLSDKRRCAILNKLGGL